MAEAKLTPRDSVARDQAELEPAQLRTAGAAQALLPARRVSDQVPHDDHAKRNAQKPRHHISHSAPPGVPIAITTPDYFFLPDRTERLASIAAARTARGDFTWSRSSSSDGCAASAAS